MDRRGPRVKVGRILAMLLCGIAVAFISVAVGCGGESANGAVTAGADTTPAGQVAPTPTAEPTLRPSSSDKTPTPEPTPKPTRSAATSPSQAGSSTSRPATKIVFVNVGQGDAEIIKSGSWTGLIDGGPSGSRGRHRERPAQRSASAAWTRSSSRIPTPTTPGDWRASSTTTAPSGPTSVRGRASAASALRSVGPPSRRCAEATRCASAPSRPRCSAPARSPGDANEDSVVLLVEAGGKRFLFTGDCTGANESLVGSICARGPPLYLLKVAHHGSRSSTSSAFLARPIPGSP